MRALNGQKGAIVGVQRGAYVQGLHIIGQQTDVAQRVVFAFARGSYVGYLSCAALHTEAGGLGHVVIVLLVFQMQEVCILLFQRLGQRVAVAHNGVGSFCATTEHRLCRTIAAAQIRGIVDDG